jgi:hypothetical protein
MSDVPHPPEWIRDDLALTLTMFEMMAIEDACTIMWLIHQGHEQEAMELFRGTEETRKVYDASTATMEGLTSVSNKIHKAMAPHRRAVGRWMAEFDRWRAEHPDEE